MNADAFYPLGYILVGLLVGALAGWLWSRLRIRKRFITVEELEQGYVAKALFNHLEQGNDLLRDDLMEKEEEIRAFAASLSAKDQTILHLDDKLRDQKKELEALQERSRLEFENIANRLLEEKSRKFTLQNSEQLNHLLAPLKEQIKVFETGIERRFLEETKDRISLKKEIEQLRLLNNQLSQDANNLANALKGNSKSQGDWGEIQLELLLQKAGLQKDIHYQVQSSFRDQNGKLKRPDFIIQLPQEKHLIIDSKVSLTAYEKSCSADTDAERNLYLKAHLESLRRHIRDLSNKNYQQLYQINTPDYLLLFVPIEPAFALAIQADSHLFTEALEKNIVLVSTSTLLATMRTVSYIWKQEKQKKSVLEIARQSGLLYDKFCAFVEDLQAIGQRIEQSQAAYHQAMNKLMDSKKYGDTLIGRAQKIKELGAKASKNLPKELLDSDNNT